MKSSVYVLALLLLFSALSISAQNQSPARDFLASHNVTSIAILPPVGESIPAEVRNLAASTFIEELKGIRPQVNVITSSETTTHLEKASRLDDYTNFLTLFLKTGTINHPLLSRIGEASGASSILLIDIQQYEAQNGSWLRMRNGHNAVRAQYTLFSANGEQLWQHLVLYVHTPQGTAKADKADKVMERVSKRAAKALLSGEQNSDSRKDN